MNHAAPPQPRRRPHHPVTGGARPPASSRPSPHRDDAGLVTVWLVFTTFIVVIIAGVIFAGGVIFGARAHGYDLAQQAARAGAQQLDAAAYRSTGMLRLDPTRAATVARQFLAAAGATGAVTVTAARITVTATSQQPTPMLATFGVHTVTITSTASATPTAGPAG